MANQLSLELNSPRKDAFVSYKLRAAERFSSERQAAQMAELYYLVTGK